MTEGTQSAPQDLKATGVLFLEGGMCSRRRHFRARERQLVLCRMFA